MLLRLSINTYRSLLLPTIGGGNSLLKSPLCMNSLCALSRLLRSLPSMHGLHSAQISSEHCSLQTLLHSWPHTAMFFWADNMSLDFWSLENNERIKYRDCYNNYPRIYTPFVSPEGVTKAWLRGLHQGDTDDATITRWREIIPISRLANMLIDGHVKLTYLCLEARIPELWDSNPQLSLSHLFLLPFSRFRIPYTYLYVLPQKVLGLNVLGYCWLWDKRFSSR